jgi:hypothetical protein
MWRFPASGSMARDRRTIKQLSQCLEFDTLEAIDVLSEPAKADAPSRPSGLLKLRENFHLYAQNARWPLDAPEVVHETTDVEPESGRR